jgi:hypothetical protein
MKLKMTEINGKTMYVQRSEDSIVKRTTTYDAMFRVTAILIKRPITFL